MCLDCSAATWREEKRTTAKYKLAQIQGDLESGGSQKGSLLSVVAALLLPLACSRLNSFEYLQAPRVQLLLLLRKKKRKKKSKSSFFEGAQLFISPQCPLRGPAVLDKLNCRAGEQAAQVERGQNQKALLFKIRYKSGPLIGSAMSGPTRPNVHESIVAN